MNGHTGNHVGFDLDRTEFIPRHEWRDKPEKRICEWKSLDLQIDSPALRSEIQAASQGVSDPWVDVGRDPGLTIWRVTKYRATLWPQEEYGHFYDADAFLVLNTYYADIDSEIPEYNVHIWVGKYAQKEEYEAVVIKCLELDWKLGYEGIVHREVQSRESDLFRSYFRPMTIWKGDAESRLRSLKGETYLARLLRFYKPNPRRPFTCMKEVPTQRQYLDSDLIFVLDIGQQVYQWNGSESHHEEKGEVISYCQKLRADRGMRCGFEMIDEVDSTDHYFNFYFKDTQDSGVLLDSDDETNVQVSRLSTLGHIHKPRLFQMVSAAGRTNFKVLKEGTIAAQDLINQKVCILDMTHECFVWIAGQAMEEKRLALQYAHDYLKQTPYPLIPVHVVREGQPCPEFERAIGYTSQNGYYTS